MNRAIILAAGEGSRLRSMSLFKPLVKIRKKALLEVVLKHLDINQFEQIHIIFNEKAKEMDLSFLPTLKKENVHFFSNLHQALCTL